MWEILSFGLKPFASLTNAEAVTQIAAGERLPRPDHCVPNLYRLMLECWMEDAVLRPTFASLQPKIRFVSTLTSSAEFLLQMFKPIDSSTVKCLRQSKMLIVDAW